MKGERFAQVVGIKIDSLAVRLFMSRSQEELGRLKEQLASFSLALLAVPPEAVESLELELGKYLDAEADWEVEEEAIEELRGAFETFLGSLPEWVVSQFTEQRDGHRPFMAELRSLVDSERNRELQRRKTR